MATVIKLAPKRGFAEALGEGLSAYLKKRTEVAEESAERERMTQVLSTVLGPEPGAVTTPPITPQRPSPVPRGVTPTTPQQPDIRTGIRAAVAGGAKLPELVQMMQLRKAIEPKKEKLVEVSLFGEEGKEIKTRMTTKQQQERFLSPELKKAGFKHIKPAPVTKAKLTQFYDDRGNPIGAPSTERPAGASTLAELKFKRERKKPTERQSDIASELTVRRLTDTPRNRGLVRRIVANKPKGVSQINAFYKIDQPGFEEKFADADVRAEKAAFAIARLDALMMEGIPVEQAAVQARRAAEEAIKVTTTPEGETVLTTSEEETPIDSAIRSIQTLRGDRPAQIQTPQAQAQESQVDIGNIQGQDVQVPQNLTDAEQVMNYISNQYNIPLNDVRLWLIENQADLTGS